MSKHKPIWFVGLPALILILAAAGAFWFIVSGPEMSTTDAAVMDDAPVYRSGPFRVSVDVNPETPKVGENRLMVKVMDAEGRPISDAKIHAFGQMLAMGAMPAMRAPADLEQVAPGEYEGPFNLEMSGPWPLTVNIKKAGMGSTHLSFDMATGRSGLNLTSGGIKVEQGGGERLSQAVTSDSDNDGSAYRAGPFKLNVALEPKTPQVGKNQLIISLQDQEGNPVSGARIDAVAEMPAMGAMPAMQAPVRFKETTPGRYKGTFNLSMSGEWPLSVEIQKEEIGKERISFDMATGRPGLQSAGAAGTITVDARQRQLIGLETGEVEYRELVRTIRAVGQIMYDETRLSDVTLRFEAWIGELKANYVGKKVKQGEVLFTVYGPELLAAQREYLEVLESRRGLPNGLIDAARKRLLLWDMRPGQIEQLESRGEPLDYVPIVAPRSGTVIDKKIVQGTANQAGATLMRIADLSRVWVEAEVYEGEVPLVREGMPAAVTLPYLPGWVFKAKVDYVYPYLEGMTRTGRIRLSLDNSDGLLKPDMYAEVKLKANLGRRLVVPEEAVLFAGESRVVFVDLGNGNLKPQKIEIGQQAGGYIEVLEGLQAGDEVVTSGNFLMASETRLKAGIEQW
jgi:Cu(I)/Ag(I) efflux system membrane fusion protein